MKSLVKANSDRTIVHLIDEMIAVGASAKVIAYGNRADKATNNGCLRQEQTEEEDKRRMR